MILRCRFVGLARKTRSGTCFKPLTPKEIPERSSLSEASGEFSSLGGIVAEIFRKMGCHRCDEFSVCSPGPATSGVKF